MRFQNNSPDFELSPYSGMSRSSWIQAGIYLLQGIFSHIHSIKEPVLVPRKEFSVTYPHKDSSGAVLELERRAEIFEGLTRSFFIAAPLLKNEPALTLCGIPLADYYREQILRCVSPSDPLRIGTYEELQELLGWEDPFRPFQPTVETCALVIGLWVSREVIWEKYSPQEKDLIAAFLSSYAHAATVPQNWRLFNMLDLAFLSMNGYPIDEEIMMEHAGQILGYYAGDGWYRDGHCFDYYSCWAFQVYAPLWNRWYGYEHAPEIASSFEAYSNELMKSYPDFFDRDAFVTMWGRSNVYRCAAASALTANFYLSSPSMKPGLARRILSGCLLQFLDREDFLVDGVPSIGFYGPFAPLVQGYSCAESVYWLGKIFLCLDLEPDHPFWRDREENGSWALLKEGEVRETVLDGPALCLSNHQANGSHILRSGKVVKNKADRHGLHNYAKIAYHSKYPWEASPAGAAEQAVESMQYVLTDESSGEESLCNVTFWHGVRDGVLYRRQFFDYDLERECMWMQAVTLADFPVPEGLFRADRIRLYRRPVTLTLGAFGFPDQGTAVLEKNLEGARAVILKGSDSQGRKKQLAMTIYDGWDELKLAKSRGSNPDSLNSLILYAKGRRSKQYGGAECALCISQVLTRESHEDFAEEELFPLKQIVYTDRFHSGLYGKVSLLFKNGADRVLDFEGIEGKLSL